MRSSTRSIGRSKETIICKGVHPLRRRESSLFFAFTSAPLAMSISAMFLLPAMCKAVWPSPLAFTSAPLAIRSRIISSLPNNTAILKGGSEMLFALTSAPFSIRSFTQSISPLIIALDICFGLAKASPAKKHIEKTTPTQNKLTIIRFFVIFVILS